MIERLSMKGKYDPRENAIHVGRYNVALQFCKGKRVLDIACGEGYGSYIIAKAGAEEVVGVDIDEETIKTCKETFKSDNLNYVRRDATDLEGIPNNSFDMIVSFETIEHVQDDKKFLKEVKRVAKKDAIIIISCPNDYYYYPNEDEKNEFHHRKYTFEDFKETAEKILGDKVKYLIGSEVAGYVNVLADSKVKKSTKNSDIVNNSIDIEAKVLKIATPNKEVCNYYLGIWNAEGIKETALVYPYMYTDWKEALDILNSDIDNLKKTVEKDKERLSEIEDLENQVYHEKLINKVLSSENEELKKIIYGLQEQVQTRGQRFKKSIIYRGLRKIKRILVRILRKIKRILLGDRNE